MCRAYGNSNPAPILMKFYTHIPTCPRKVLVLVKPPPLSLTGHGGLKPYKLKDTFLKTKDIRQVGN